MEYGEGQRDHKGSKESMIIFPWVGDFPGDGALQLGLEESEDEAGEI